MATRLDEIKSILNREFDLSPNSCITPCPKCRLFIKKAGGCDAVVCPSCGFGFNSRTGLSTADHHARALMIGTMKREKQVAYWNDWV